MDCCNYVQPYMGAGHFYQQHNFCYDNTNAYAANYNMAPVTNAIEANVRYNRLPPAYPTDYVYNPKEARLRKAMREQSRELSRQSILQTAIASASVTGNNAAPTSANFHHPLTCASSAAAAAAVSSLPSSPSINPTRIINPWFPVSHAPPTAHLKPILSPRIMAAHQRTLEKTKEAIRKQVECAAAGVFSSGSAGGYAGDFAATHGTSRVGAGSGTGPGPGPGQGANEYCIIAEFSDGQKWHPYQNGINPYHGRGAAMSKIGGLHPNVQNTSTHGPWGQFCGLPLQTPSTQNQVIRAPRHMVFLQDQQSQHCTFGDEMQLSLSYVPNKVEINPRLQVAYPQADPQAKTAVSPSQMHHLQEDEKCGEGETRWDSAASTTVPETIVASRGQDHDQEIGQASVDSDRERDDDKSKTGCKQPLPGFHQAFGSTEIGRFSRSEFFANMVGESNNVIPEAYLSTPVFPFSPTSQAVLGNPTMPPGGSSDEDLLQQIMPEDCYWLGVGGGGAGGGQNHQTPAQSGIESATNYAAFLDYSHRLSQEWLLHPAAAISQDLQAAFIEQPACLFHESNCGSLLGHDQQYLAYNTTTNSCPSYDHNRHTPTNMQNIMNDHASLNYMQMPSQSSSRGNSGDGGPERPIVIKQNDRICVMLESNQIQMEKDIM